MSDAMRSMRTMRERRAIDDPFDRESMRQIRRSNAKTEKNSCDPPRLRVKMRRAFDCSIKRSNAELNSDSHSRRSVVSRQGHLETLRSCGVSPSRKTAHLLSLRPGFDQFPHSPPSDAGFAPAFLLRAPGRGPALANRAEFISVNGQCPVRSALRSDMRHSKRISGHAAATEPPHAPMNSPVRRLWATGFPFEASSINLSA
jgi:hypothetical protein